MSRTLEQINAEYTQTAVHLGDKTYRKLVIETEINTLVVTMNRLDTEAAELKKSLKPAENTTSTDEEANGLLDLPQMTPEQMAEPDSYPVAAV